MTSGYAEKNGRVGEMEVFLTVPINEANAAVEALRSAGAFDPDAMPASGAEGGGARTSIVATLTQEAVSIFSTIVQRFASGSDVTLVIGQTTLSAKRLKEPDVEALIAATLKAELKRAGAKGD